MVHTGDIEHEGAAAVKNIDPLFTRDRDIELFGQRAARAVAAENVADVDYCFLSIRRRALHSQIMESMVCSGRVWDEASDTTVIVDHDGPCLVHGLQ